MIFQRDALEEFDLQPVTSTEMDTLISRCANIYRGVPEWLDKDSDIRTIKFAKVLCEEIARLTMLGAKVKIDGSVRADWLMKQVDKRYFNLRQWVEYGCAYGTIILKPNGTGVDFLTPFNFQVVDTNDDGDILGIVFVDQYNTNTGITKKYYTKFEYHRFKDVYMDGQTQRQYLISNRVYVSDTANDKGKQIELDRTKWAGLQSEVALVTASGSPIERPLFGVFRMPKANDQELNSPLGKPAFSEVIEELKNLDIAYSRNSEEIKDSRRIILLDDRLLMPSGEKIKGKSAGRAISGLPHYVKNIFGNGPDDFYEEINPVLNTDTRIKGINNELSFIGWKVGFSSGYFVFDQKTGMVTATQVESDDRRTIQFIKDCRDKLEDCLDGLIYALNVFADLYNLAPVGNYEITYDFGDITYNREEDRARWWNYVVQNRVPAWMYFVKFEGMSEDEAKAMTEEAKPEEPKGFFAEE
jgi:A118 family predicted phage portal protein